MGARCGMLCFGDQVGVIGLLGAVALPWGPRKRGQFEAWEAAVARSRRVRKNAFMRR